MPLSLVNQQLLKKNQDSIRNNTIDVDVIDSLNLHMKGQTRAQIIEFVKTVASQMTPDNLHKVTIRLLHAASRSEGNMFLRNNTLSRHFLAYEMANQPVNAQQHYDDAKGSVSLHFQKTYPTPQYPDDKWKTERDGNKKVAMDVLFPDYSNRASVIEKKEQDFKKIEAAMLAKVAKEAEKRAEEDRPYTIEKLKACFYDACKVKYPIVMMESKTEKFHEFAKIGKIALTNPSAAKAMKHAIDRASEYKNQIEATTTTSEFIICLSYLLHDGDNSAEDLLKQTLDNINSKLQNSKYDNPDMIIAELSAEIEVYGGDNNNCNNNNSNDTTDLRI